jgi:hypothetical protein
MIGSEMIGGEMIGTRCWRCQLAHYDSDWMITAGRDPGENHRSYGRQDWVGRSGQGSAARTTASALVEPRPDDLIEMRPERTQTIGRFPDMIGVGTHRRSAQFRLAPPLDVRSISQS